MGVKLWPVLLIGVLLRAMAGDRRRLIRTGAVFCGLLALTFAAYLPGLGMQDGGARHYATWWRANAGVYTLLRAAAGMIEVPLEAADPVIRVALAAVVIALAARAAHRPIASADDLFTRAGTIVLIVFLLNPTLYPWYAVALIPFAAIRPRGSLLAWTLLLPIVYLPLDGWLGHWGVPILVHGTVWGLLLIEGSRFRVRGSGGKPPAAPGVLIR